MLKRVGLLVVLAALAMPSPAAAGSKSTVLVPGVGYTKHVRWAYGGPLVYHVVVGPKPGGLYRLRPVLSGNRVTGTRTVSAMQRRQLRRAHVVGVNGDFFSRPAGNPNGLLVRRGRVDVSPEPSRSSLGVGVDGLLRIARIDFAGRWETAAGASHRLRMLNRPLPTNDGFALFTRAWGARTPPGRRAGELLLGGLARTFPNRARKAVVRRVRAGAGHRIPRDGAILQARGPARHVLFAAARRGDTLQFTFGLQPWWEDVQEAIGGGPVLVRGGQAVVAAGEGFSSYQLSPNHPRTAVGQRADGRIVLVVADGRSPLSGGLTNAELARELVAQGAVEAMAFDGGGSSTLAFNGRVLNRPADGRERPVSTSFQLEYYGVYAPRPRFAVHSPNGDGVADVQRLSARLLRPASVHIRLVQPDGRVRWQLERQLRAGTYTRSLRRRSLPEGRWRWVVKATDEQGLTSTMRQRFTVNKTLGFLRLSSGKVRIWPRAGGRLVSSFRLARQATIRVEIRRRSGRHVRTLVSQRGVAPGSYAAVWDGRSAARRFVADGRYRVVVRASNELGAVEQSRGFVVRRMRRPPGPN